MLKLPSLCSDLCPLLHTTKHLPRGEEGVGREQEAGIKRGGQRRRPEGERDPKNQVRGIAEGVLSKLVQGPSFASAFCIAFHLLLVVPACLAGLQREFLLFCTKCSQICLPESLLINVC